MGATSSHFSVAGSNTSTVYNPPRTPRTKNRSRAVGRHRVGRALQVYALQLGAGPVLGQEGVHHLRPRGRGGACGTRAPARSTPEPVASSDRFMFYMVR